MYYTKEILENISRETLDLIKKYSDPLPLKNDIDLTQAYDTVWSDSLDEPYAPDLISGIEKGIHPKIYKREPAKKSFVRKNHYLDGKPVYSVLYAENEPFSEKFYISDGRYIVGAEFHIASASLISLTLSAYDENGRPAEYRSAAVKSMNGRVFPKGLPSAENTVYIYENGIISKAEYFNNFGLSDERNTAEPNEISTYSFENVENNVSMYSRISYSGGESHEAGPWKISSKTDALIKGIFSM